jgi:hypothetical protein
MIVAHVPNLFDRSRFGDRVTFVDTPEEAQRHQPDLVLVDLDRCEDMASFRLEGVDVVGFGPHADAELHDRALACGYSEVVPRSLFFKRLPDLLKTS